MVVDIMKSTKATNRKDTTMTKAENKAYENGAKMAAYIIERDGVAQAAIRDSLAAVRYSRKSLADAYNRGYWNVVLGA